jgi:ubiquinone biosynthesis protein UbiJ
VRPGEEWDDWTPGESIARKNQEEIAALRNDVAELRLAVARLAELLANLAVAAATLETA